jgi:hypothetical protein
MVACRSLLAFWPCPNVNRYPAQVQQSPALRLLPATLFCHRALLDRIPEPAKELLLPISEDDVDSLRISFAWPNGTDWACIAQSRGIAQPAPPPQSMRVIDSDNDTTGAVGIKRIVTL